MLVLNTCAITCLSGSGATCTRCALAPSPLKNGGGLPSAGFGMSRSKMRSSSGTPAPVSAETKHTGIRWPSRRACSKGSWSCSGEISAPCSR